MQPNRHVVVHEPSWCQPDPTRSSEARLCYRTAQGDRSSTAGSAAGASPAAIGCCPRVPVGYSPGPSRCGYSTGAASRYSLKGAAHRSEMMAAPSSARHFENGGIEPGEMPPMSAWCPAKKAVAPEHRRAPPRTAECSRRHTARRDSAAARGREPTRTGPRGIPPSACQPTSSASKANASLARRPSPGADVGGMNPVPVQMWEG